MYGISPYNAICLNWSLASPRCGAKTRAGKPCQSPGVRGNKRCRMQGGAPGSGAPTENQNALKHGLFTKDAIEERKQVGALTGRSRKLLRDIEQAETNPRGLIILGRSGRRRSIGRLHNCTAETPPF
jgi:hypothetical protein